jgi:glucokinase
MDANAMYLGIDLGGTATKLGVIDASGGLVSNGKIPTPELITEEQCRAHVTKIADFVHGSGVYSSELAGVGLALPGIIVNGVPQLTPNVKADWPVFMSVMTAEFGAKKIECINDANAAALGEMWHGAAAGAKSTMLVTIGTGIGAGIVADGRVVQGHGGAGEIGHITVVPDGRPCRCGRAGCLEQYASSRGIVANFREAQQAGAAATSQHEPKSDTDSLAVFEAYREGDARAVQAVGQFVQKLGYALAQTTCVVDADVILLGGGVAGAAELFIDDLEAVYRKYCLSTCRDAKIRVAGLGNTAGVVGAVRYAQMQRESLDPFDDLFGMTF